MTDDDKALVERLRWGAWYYEDPFDGKAYASDDPLEAADRIEADGRQIAALKRRVEQLKSMFDTVSKKLEKAHTELKGMK